MIDRATRERLENLRWSEPPALRDPKTGETIWISCNHCDWTKGPVRDAILAGLALEAHMRGHE